MSLEARLHLILHSASVILLLVAVILLSGLATHIDYVDSDVSRLAGKLDTIQQCMVTLAGSPGQAGFCATTP
jgi:hypothetical protein